MRDMGEYLQVRALRTLSAAVLIGSFAALGGCGGNQGAAPRSAAAVAPPETSAQSQERIKAAIAFLNQGDPQKAREQLVKVLVSRPGDMLAQNLLKQIDTEPTILLGTENFKYTIKRGETLSVLADRYLGDPTMSYALARYNGLASPLQAKEGQVIHVPGKRKSAAPAVAKKPTAAPATAKAAPPPAKPAGNPALAAKLRGQGLAALNGGAVNRAVLLFRRALAYDPGNATIKNDLSRALRIQGTVSGRP